MQDDNLSCDIGISGLDNPVTNFETGAVRDLQVDKGRCDLMPLAIIANLIRIWEDNFLDMSHLSETELKSGMLKSINNYIYEGDPDNLLHSICYFTLYAITWCEMPQHDMLYYAILDVSKHYKNGLEKYGERNWEKGIPLHSYIDSGVRHLLKYFAHFKDERHDLAFIWNLLCCCHTELYINNKQLKDLPFCKN